MLVHDARLPVPDGDWLGFKRGRRLDWRWLWRRDSSEVIGHARYHDTRSEQERCLESKGRLVVQDLLPPVGGYELGQHDLASAVLVRREASLARTADLEARIALARTRVAVDRAAGVLL